MQTFHLCEQDTVENGVLTVRGDVCHHLARVLRIRVGERLRFSDGNHYYEGPVTEITRDTVCVAAETVTSVDDEPRLKVTLIQCLPRGDKMEQILQKCTELGVSRVIPVESDNSQIRLKNKKQEKQIRWQKVVSSAAEQCGRGVIPRVEIPCGLEDAIDSLGEEKLLFCYELEANNSFRETAVSLKAETESVALFIGPEGGFSEREANLILERGGKSVTMGNRILRTETAGPTALAVLMYEFGEWEARHEN